MPFAHGAWLWFSKNPIAQAIAGVALFFILKAGHARYHQHRGARRERERNLKRSQKIQKTILEQSNEKSAQVAAARDSVQPARTTRELRDDQRRRLIRPERDSGSG